MSVESQVILAGHYDADRIAKLLRSEISGKVAVRDMQRPEYKIIEFQRLDGSRSALHLFLDSWAADDYADVFRGPSTLMTAEYTPQNYILVRAIAAALGGLVRQTAADPWVEQEPATT